MAESARSRVETPRRRRIATEPRSRKGCRTCRVRRVKCDEQRPSCLRCSDTGRSCEWFPKPSFSYSRNPSPDGTIESDGESSRTSCSWHYSGPKRCLLPLPDSPHLSSEQRRCFFYFRQRTVAQLSGAFSPHFWDCVVLQATHHSEAIRHAVIALGSLHERFENCDSSIHSSNWNAIKGDFALEEYIHAISTLVKPARTSSVTQVDVYLVACVLFASFEALRGHHGSAVAHIKSGVRILAEIGKGINPACSRIKRVSLPEIPLVPLELLAILFTRLDTQASQLQGSSAGPGFMMTKYWASRSNCFCSEIPLVFRTIDEARNALDFAWNDISHALEDPGCVQGTGSITLEKMAGPTAAFERQKLLTKSVRWSTAVNKFIDKPGTKLSEKELSATQMMKLFALIGRVALETTGPVSEMVYDSYHAEFAEVIELATAIVRIDVEEAQNCFKGRRTPRFNLDMGVVTCLFEVVWKCRDPVLRRKGLAILEDYPRQEGLWDGILVAKICRRVIAIEEGHDGVNIQDGIIPEWARVVEVDISYDFEGRNGWLTFKMWDAAQYVEAVEW